MRNKEDGKEPFVVVADIKDAFGSVMLPKLADILKEISKDMPEKYIYVHHIKYTRPYSNIPVTKIVTSPDEDNSKGDLDKHYPARSSRLKATKAPRKIDVQAALKKVIKRSRLHTLQFRVGTKRRYYLVTRGIVQVKKCRSILTYFFNNNFSGGYIV